MSILPQLSDFIGEWRLERVIEDRLSGQAGRFSGRAQFTAIAAGLERKELGPNRNSLQERAISDKGGSFKAPHALAYHEAGELRMGAGPALMAERRYLWHAEGGQICVDHADGRPFHAFDPKAPQARHWCDPDDYQVCYAFGRWPEWRVKWVVTGPRKNYTMTSTYSRDW